MEKLDLAIRQYERLLLAIDRARDGLPKPAQVWLETDVLSALRELSGLPSFQVQARWALDSLIPGAETAERAAIDRLSAALQEFACELLAGTRSLRGPRPPKDSGKVTPADALNEADVQVLLAQVEKIAEGTIEDLVNPQDYFEPEPEFVELPDGTRVQRGESIVSLNPELLPIGNYVVLRMQQRLRIRIDCMQQLRRRLERDERATRSELPEAINAKWRKVSRESEELEVLLRGPEPISIRDASVVAVQVLYAYDDDFDVCWLGLSEHSVRRSKPSLRHRISGLRGREITDRIATALEQLRGYYARLPPTNGERERAIAAGGLVIDQSTGEVFWRRTSIGINLNQKPGKLLFELARNAKLRRPATVGDVYGDTAVSDSAIGTLVHRLRNLLPAELREMIKDAGRAAYQLDLDPTEIVILPGGRKNV